jgi:methylated-DNA-[protein]-cysteine S-methyltransferase
VPQLSLHSPIGGLTVSEEVQSIVALDWGWGRDQSETDLLCRARDQLQAYFDGELAYGFDLPLAAAGMAYRQRVWRALCRIPRGATRTYGEIAAELGGSPRSVGQVSAANPIPILIPCHRVMATQRRAGQPLLGGYSREGGLDTKRWLLGHRAAAELVT